MGRSALLIDSGKIERVIAELETDKTFSSIGELCDAVAESEYGKSIRNSRLQVRGISPQKVYAFIREAKIPHKTRAGARGRAKGATYTKRTKADKLHEVPQMEKWLSGILRMVSLPEIPARYKDIAQKAAEGNVRACVAITCASCCGFENQAWKTCQSTTCGLVPLNLMMWPERKVAVKDDDDWKLVSPDSEEAKTGVAVQLTSGKGMEA